MKTISVLFMLLILLASCNLNGKKAEDSAIEPTANIPIDKGFGEYIAGYTSGIIPSNSSVEIRFTPDFARKAKRTTSGLFEFDPSIKGKTEWRDSLTLVFTPSEPLESGKSYNGVLKLIKLADVDERLEVFPIRIQTPEKNFRFSLGPLECSSNDGSTYMIHGEVTAADYIDPSEAEGYLTAKLEKRNVVISWDHASNLVHKFTINNIERTSERQELVLEWDGTKGGIDQEGTANVMIPPTGEFMVLEVLNGSGQRIDVVFSDPVDISQELKGLIYFSDATDGNISINLNVVSIFPSKSLKGAVRLNVDAAVKNQKGVTLSGPYSKDLEYGQMNPVIQTEGDGIIIPVSTNLIFPFKAANLKAVDLRIVRIFENNLPYFLQENEITGGYSLKRFGRPVYSGRVDLTAGPGMSSGGMNLYSINLSDYIEVEPGVLYKVYLGMRKSYSLYPCADAGEKSRFEEMLDDASRQERELWDDSENYYDDNYDRLYYNYGFSWDDSDDPCKEAYYSPHRKVSRNVLATNLGLTTKLGNDKKIHVLVNDIVSTAAIAGVTVELYDYQMQQITSGSTDIEGYVVLECDRKPFLLIARKEKDRNYLKLTDGSSLSLSSFDIGGSTPQKGIKAFIYGERDVWRPGDNIYLSVFIKDMLNELPAEHPVQFELVNPLDQKVDNQVQKTDGKKLLVFTTKTSADAITGYYTARFRVGGAVFTKTVRVETIKPNRLKMNLKFPSDTLGGKEKVRGTLKVQWMNGTTAKNIKSSVEYLLTRSVTSFEKFRNYLFEDPSIQFTSETVQILDDNTDSEGNAAVDFEPSIAIKSPGMLNARFTVKASEPGGDESITQVNYKYSPYDVYAGISFPGLEGKNSMLYTDRDNEIKIVTVNDKGIPVNSKLELTIYKLSHRWWWESSRENLGEYISGNYYTPVVRKSISTAGGQASETFKIDKENWGRYLVRVSIKGGHSAGRIIYVDWPWEYGMKEGASGAAFVSINTDKEKYIPGDEVKLTFPTPANAKVIITLENSVGIIDRIITKADKGNTIVSFKATPGMAPNVYAYVDILQPHAQTVNDMPVRLYGVVPVMVEDPDTRLIPEINMPDELRSQKEFVINVSEKNNKSMTYTLAIVDEGLLDLTGFRTPDPWNYFYAREALGVKTWDVYNYVLGAYGGTLERMFGIGGDGEATDKSAQKAQRFIPVVRFLGPFTLEAGKKDRHSVTLPQYTGSVRTMVIAGDDKAFGMAEKSVFVKDPLMVLVTAPRVISPGEKAALPMTLFIQKDGIRNISITAESNDVISFDEKKKSVSVRGIGEQEAEFLFTAGEKTGIAGISITASGGGETAKYDLELEIRSPNPPETRSELKIIRPGEKWDTSFKPFGLEGSNAAKLEVSSLPSVNLEKRLGYLIDYPYGCSEQITSSAFPQLFLKNIIDNESQTAKAGQHISAAVNIMLTRQMANGGIAMWPGAYSPDLWVTSYAGHFMIEAEKQGFVVPSGFINKWVRFQQQTAGDWRYDPAFIYSANDQAYRLFTLALAGKPERGAMNRLREAKKLPDLSRWLLAGAFVLSGRPEAANDLIDVRNTSFKDESYHYYGGHVRDKAIVLYTLTLLKKEEIALPLAKEISDNLSNANWYSTQSISWGLFAYMKWAEMLSVDASIPLAFSWSLNSAGSDETIKAKEIWSQELKIDDTNSLSVENTSKGSLYATLTIKGVSFVSDQTLDEKGLSMKISYTDRNMSPVNYKDLSQGTDFLMVVKVSNNTFSRVENIALTKMVPSGWEIQNTRIFSADYGIKESTYDYRDFRDDRVNTFFSLNNGETKTFVLILNAAYKGEFYQPSVFCEAMYTPNCYSRHPGGKVTVTGPEFE